ncbi:MAG: hypothetical protein LBM98_07860 [Oscillospiraceae bacterium]|jgi:hypothetical protein|nr:hypothetical protein [Oscillospiraceae bacterium]
MFFHSYNPLTSEIVAEKLAKATRPTADKYCGVLSGKSLKIKLTGEFAPTQLDYSFLSDAELSVIENGIGYTVPYGAISLGDLTVFSHLIPNSQRGWHIVLDRVTELVTAFETWFGISVPVGGDLFGMRQPTHNREIPREIQRHYHFGYVDKGGDAPEKLHTTTNRLEGRGLHWKYSCGSENLTFFPSVVCSLTTWLDEPQDAVSVTYPSDYIRINDEYYIYAKWGVEFGGEMWLELIDLFHLEAAGLKFGFGKDDELTYALHTAKLTVTGDAAHLETITVNGDKAPPMAMLTGKGARYAYRPKDIDIPMTKAEAYEAAKTQRIFEFGGPNIMMSGNTLPFSEALVGKKFSLGYDKVQTPYAWSEGNRPDNLIQDFEYDIVSKETLKWRKPGGEWHEEKYVCFEPAHDIYFFSHMVTGDTQFSNVSQAVDFSTGLTTCVWGRVGSWTSDWEIGATVLFGTAKGEGIAEAPFSTRHSFSSDFVGRSLAWAYSDTMSSIHTYSSPVSYSWTIFQDDNSGCATWSSPGFFIKLRNDAYLFQWVEENCNGSQGLVCYNPYILHDGGFFFGLGHAGLSLNITGAFARQLGQFDIKKYFTK